MGLLFFFFQISPQNYFLFLFFAIVKTMSPQKFGFRKHFVKQLHVTKRVYHEYQPNKKLTKNSVTFYDKLRTLKNTRIARQRTMSQMGVSNPQ